MFSLSFVGGSKSAEEGPNPLVYLDRGGSISASGFGLGSPYPLAVLDRGVPNLGGSKSSGTPASSRRQKISMILQIAPLTDQISVLGGIVVPIADVGCQKKCPAMVKVGLSRFQKLIGELASVYHR